MTPEIHALFKNKEYCFQEIGTIRQSIGNVNATEETFDAAFSTLALMLIHCPAEIEDIVRSQLTETTMRHTYFLMKKR